MSDADYYGLPPIYEPEPRPRPPMRLVIVVLTIVAISLAAALATLLGPPRPLGYRYCWLNEDGGLACGLQPPSWATPWETT